jgi:hypothetical protein
MFSSQLIKIPFSKGIFIKKYKKFLDSICGYIGQRHFILVWTGFIWTRIKQNGGLLWAQ